MVERYLNFSRRCGARSAIEDVSVRGLSKPCETVVGIPSLKASRDGN